MQYLNKSVLILFIIGVLSSCSEEIFHKGDYLVGSWQAIELTSIYLNHNKVQSLDKISCYEFYENKNGTSTSKSNDETHEIKWAYQESDTGDTFLLSTSLNSSNGPSILSINTLNSVVDIGETNMQLFREKTEIIGDTTLNYKITTYFTKV